MKRTNLICCIALAVMFSLAACNDDFGLNYITTTSNGDPNSCLLNLTYTVHPKKIVFTVKQYIPDPINRSCTYQDITSAPLFWVATVPFTPKSIGLTASPYDPNTLTGEWTYNDMISSLGKSCLDTGFYSNPPNQIYTCRFKWSSLYIYVDFLMVKPLNTTFDVTATRVLFPELVNALQSSKYGFDNWVPNPSFPQRIIGRLMDGCGANNWDNVINSLSTHVTITGTEYNSPPYFDLHTYFDSAITYNAIVRNAAGQFITKQFMFNPFDHPGVAGCTDMGITYGQILPNLNFCRDGCSITFILIRDVQQYALSTNGIKTAGSLRE